MVNIDTSTVKTTPRTNGGIASYRMPILLCCAIVISFLSIIHRNSDSISAASDCILQSSTALITNKDPDSKTSDGKKSKKPLVDLTNYKGPQTTYEPWPLRKQPFPCVQADNNWKTVKVQRSPARTGLLYVREMKTGSSTMAGVMLRLAHRKGKELLESGPCRMRIDHSSATKLEYARRNKKRSYMISLLREPTKRAISQYFHFRVSEKKEDPIDENFQNYFFDDPMHRSSTCALPI